MKRPSSLSSRNTSLGGMAVVITMIGWAAYYNALTVPFIFDDYYVIVENFAIWTFDPAVLWRFDPSRFLTHWTFALNYHFGALNTYGYHVVNIGLHLMTAYAVFLFSRMITSCFADGRHLDDHSSWRVAITAALIFLTHPLQTQAVTYIAQRSTILAALFYFVTLILYVRYRMTGDRRFWGAGFVVFGIGLLTKPMIITLPLMLMWTDTIIFTGSRTTARRWADWVPYIALAALVPALLMLWRFGGLDMSQLLEVTRESESWTRGQYLLTQFNVLSTYARLVLWPVHLSLDYDYPVVRSLWEFSTIISFFLFCGYILLIMLWRQKRPLVAYGMGWILIALSLESSIFPIADVINEHRMYLPMAGVGLLAGLFLKTLVKDRRIWMGILILLTTALAGMTHRRNAEWNDPVGFYEDLAHRFPHKSRIRSNLGVVYALHENDQGAESEALAALNLDPQNYRAFNNVAWIYLKRGEVEKALAFYERAIAVNPKFAVGHQNFADAYASLGQWDKAEIHYRNVLQIYPWYAPALMGMGMVFVNNNDFRMARHYYREAIRLEPQYLDAYVKLGDLFVRMGDLPSAQGMYQEALRRNPRYPEAVNNLANVYDLMRSTQESVQLYWQAIGFDQGYAEAYCNLANVVDRQGEQKLATEYRQRALDLWKSRRSKMPVVCQRGTTPYEKIYGRYH